MRIYYCLLISICAISFSCNSEKDNIPLEIDCNFDFKNFEPEILDYSFFIEANINNLLLRYPQINFDNINVSNKYFSDFEETWLQAYSDFKAKEGSWKLRFHNLNIENIILPYQLKENEGSLTWYDSRLDQVIESTDYCQGIDNGCIFRMDNKMDNFIIIDNVENNVIEGRFGGTMNISRTGMTPGSDENICYQISDGKFRINYRKE